MRVLVTGGAGYLGTSLVQQLAERTDVEEIVVYDNLSRRNYSFFLGGQDFLTPIRFQEADILDSRTFRRALEGIDVVFHLAAKATTPFADSQAQLYEQVNHWGTAETVYAVEQSNVQRFIFVSSASVYGSSRDEVDETTSPAPNTIYGRSKHKAEKQVMRLWNSKTEAFVVRCGNIYGYNRSMRFDGVINRFMFESIHSGKITINGDGEQFRSFISIDRAASITARLLDTSLDPGCYNMVDNSFTINEIANEMGAVFDGLERVYINQDLQLKHLRVHPNSQICELGSQPVIPLPEFLTDFSKQFSI